MFKKLKFNLLTYSISITLVTIFIVAAVSFGTMKEVTEDNINKAIVSRLKIIADNIDYKLKLVDNLILWISMNSEVTSLLKLYNESSDPFNKESIAAHKILRNSIHTSGLHPYVEKALIGSSSNRFIQTGSINGNIADDNIALDFLIEPISKLIYDPFIYSNGELIYPKHMAIKDYSNNSKIIGNFFLTLNTDIFTKYINFENFKKEEKVYLGLGGRIYQLLRGEVFLAKDIDSNMILDYAQSNIEKGETAIPVKSLFLNGLRYSLVIYKDMNTDFFLAYVSPEVKLNWQGSIFSNFLIIMVIILFLIVSILLIIEKTINKPIHTLLKKTQSISEGDFTVDLSIEYDNEIGMIGQGINDMVGKIEKLMDKRVTDERIKKDLEFKVLQSQINPHFLYNTLNSIKWMAIAQKTTGIPEMVDSLAILLKHISKGTDQMVTLKQELFLLEKYCNIQSFRSAGIVDLNIEFEFPDLKDCMIVKFTLQPLIENAIIHGIEPKRIQGEIDIAIKKESDNDILITIRDNGIGIEKDNLLTILKHSNDNSQSFNHIGLSNVDKRLKLYFGNKYGLSIESVYGEYTLIKILIPYSGVLHA